MAYIYRIVNDINDKIYIGKTQFSIEKRFRQHCKDSQRQQCNKRPLYNAMRKYGIQHFSIELIEETNNPEEREKFWIEQYNSYKNGYNATIGGDGKAYANYALIYNLWQEGKNILQIHNILKYDTKTIRTALNHYNVTEKERKKRGRKACSKSIAMLDKTTENILKIFPSIQEAFKFLGRQSGGQISGVCKGKRKTAYGYKWKYIE